ncbi:hypothetical protein [Priestia taiwanensis]|uniref:Uncharacterized protein n=1 Tax=Priestia taiwanensis TaxID=1347902 RepID=A0A917EMJ2_9BACI|nr:hypothetical protein [Priestia taiwanensis]MBM7361836.1 hypothetical protein [Priestia taiwanensis]GGE57321.1 hypothetical protein GCM10007140_04610 [Priestia taiwanensis]
MYPPQFNRSPFPPFHPLSRMDHRFGHHENPQLQSMFQPYHGPSMFGGYPSNTFSIPNMFGGEMQGMQGFGSPFQSFPSHGTPMDMTYSSSPFRGDMYGCPPQQPCMQPQPYYQPQSYVQPQQVSPVAELPMQQPITAPPPPPEPIAVSPMESKPVPQLQPLTTPTPPPLTAPATEGPVPTQIKVYSIEGKLTEATYKTPEKEQPVVQPIQQPAQQPAQEPCQVITQPIVQQPIYQPTCPQCMEIIQPQYMPCGCGMRTRVKRMKPVEVEVEVVEEDREVVLQETLDEIKNSIKQLKNMQKAFRATSDNEGS